jgi:hypothetical protein
MKNRLFLTAITITISCSISFSHLLSHTAIANDEFFEDEDFLKLITEVEEKGSKKNSTPISSMERTKNKALILPEEASNDKDTPFKQNGALNANQQVGGKDSTTKKLFDRVGKLFTNDPFAKEEKPTAKAEQKSAMKHFTLDGPKVESSKAISRSDTTSSSTTTQNASSIDSIEDLKKVTLPDVPQVKEAAGASVEKSAPAKIDAKKKQREVVEEPKLNKVAPVKSKDIPEAEKILPKPIIHKKAEIKVKDKAATVDVEPAFENKGRAVKAAPVANSVSQSTKKFAEPEVNEPLATELDIVTLPGAERPIDESKALGDNLDLKASEFDLELPKLDGQMDENTQPAAKVQKAEKGGVFAKIGGFFKGFFEEEDEAMHEEDMELNALEERLLREIEEEQHNASSLRSRATTSKTKAKVQKQPEPFSEVQLEADHVPNLENFDPKSFEDVTEDQQLRQLVEDDMKQALEVASPTEELKIELPQLQVSQDEKPKVPEQQRPQEDRQALLPRKPKPVTEKRLPSIDEMDKAKSLGTISADEMFGLTNKPRKLESADTIFDYWRKNKETLTKPFADEQQGIDAANNVYKLDIPTKPSSDAAEFGALEVTQKAASDVGKTNESVKAKVKAPEQHEGSAVDANNLTEDLLKDKFFKQALEARKQQQEETSSKPMVKRGAEVDAKPKAKPTQEAAESEPIRIEDKKPAAKPMPFKDVSEVLRIEDPVEDRSLALTTGSNIEDISEVMENADEVEEIFDGTEPLTIGDHEVTAAPAKVAEPLEDELDAPNETLLSSEAAAKAEELSPVKQGPDGDSEPEDIEAIEDGAYSLYADEVLPTYLEGVKNRGKYSHEKDVSDNPIYRKQYGEKNQHLPAVADVADYTRYLFYAAYENNVEAMKSLIDRGADINAQDENTGYTPAILALISGKQDAVAYLVNIGADVNIRDNSGNSLLQHALLRQDLNSYKLILKVAPKLSKAVIRQSLETMVENGHSQEWAQPLIEFMGGADTMLIQFAKVNDYYGVRLALNAGADLQVVDSSSGLSVFEYAVINQNVMMLEELYEADPEGFMAMRDRLRSMAYRSNNSQFKVAFENMLVTIEMQQGAR